MAVLVGPRFPPVAERQRRLEAGGGLEQLHEILQERRLVGLDDEQVIAARVQHLLAELPLTEERIAGQHAILPVHACHQRGGDAQFGLRLLGGDLNRFLGQDDALLVAKALSSCTALPPVW